MQRSKTLSTQGNSHHRVNKDWNFPLENKFVFNCGVGASKTKLNCAFFFFFSRSAEHVHIDVDPKKLLAPPEQIPKCPSAGYGSGCEMIARPNILMVKKFFFYKISFHFTKFYFIFLPSFFLVFWHGLGRWQNCWTIQKTRKLVFCPQIKQGEIVGNWNRSRNFG